MTVARIAWRRVGAFGLLAAALVLAGTLPAHAGPVVASGTASSSSNATSFFASASSSQTDGPHFTPLSASSNATASDSFGSFAQNTGSATLSLTAPGAGMTQTLTGHADSSGNSATGVNANGVSTVTGFFNLTGNYQYTLSATGSASSAGGAGFGDNSSASLSIPDAGVSDSTSAPLFGGTNSFSDTRSGILGNGPHSFSASASDNTSFVGSSASLDFSLQLTPIPEPGTFALMGPSLLLVGLVFVGAAGIGWVRRRKALATA
jgi:hypothetical protein